MEITKDKVTELFCIIDEFYKVFDAENAGKLLLGEDGVKRRRRKASLSDSEIMTILLYFHFGSFRNFKHYYLFFIRGTLKSYFPNAVDIVAITSLDKNTEIQAFIREAIGQTECEVWVRITDISTVTG